LLPNSDIKEFYKIQEHHKHENKSSVLKDIKASILTTYQKPDRVHPGVEYEKTYFEDVWENFIRQNFKSVISILNEMYVNNATIKYKDECVGISFSLQEKKEISNQSVTFPKIKGNHLCFFLYLYVRRHGIKPLFTPGSFSIFASSFMRKDTEKMKEQIDSYKAFDAEGCLQSFLIFFKSSDITVSSPTPSAEYIQDPYMVITDRNSSLFTFYQKGRFHKDKSDIAWKSIKAHFDKIIDDNLEEEYQSFCKNPREYLRS
jgi:hypothetical protein